MKRVPSRHSTVPRVKQPRPKPPLRRAAPLPPKRAKIAPPPMRVPHAKPPRSQVAHIVDDSESSLVDVLDSLLPKGVMLNADLILALADVDLVYVRLSALLCAADRVFPMRGR
jgi:hypothetical protein